MRHRRRVRYRSAGEDRAEGRQDAGGEAPRLPVLGRRRADDPRRYREGRRHACDDRRLLAARQDRGLPSAEGRARARQPARGRAVGGGRGQRARRGPAGDGGRLRAHGLRRAEEDEGARRQSECRRATSASSWSAAAWRASPPPSKRPRPATTSSWSRRKLRWAAGRRGCGSGCRFAPRIPSRSRRASPRSSRVSPRIRASPCISIRRWPKPAARPGGSVSGSRRRAAA